MTNRQVETSREIRLWIKEIIVPAASLAVTTIVLVPEIRYAVSKKIKSTKETVKNKFKKKEA